MRTCCFGLCYTNVHLKLATGPENLVSIQKQKNGNDFSSYILMNRRIHVYAFIIQQIVTLSKYGHDALDICYP